MKSLRYSQVQETSEPLYSEKIVIEIKSISDHLKSGPRSIHEPLSVLGVHPAS